MTYAAAAARGTGRRPAQIIEDINKYVIRGRDKNLTDVFRNTVCFHDSQFDTENIDIKLIANKLREAKYDTKIKHVSYNGKIIEITFKDGKDKVETLKNGLKLGEKVILVRDPAIRIWSVTMINVPSEYTNLELANHVMVQYGKLSSMYESAKTEGGILFKNGNRVFQYSAVDKLPPKAIEIDGIKIRLVFSTPPTWMQTVKFVENETSWGGASDNQLRKNWANDEPPQTRNKETNLNRDAPAAGARGPDPEPQPMEEETPLPIPETPTKSIPTPRTEEIQDFATQSTSIEFQLSPAVTKTDEIQSFPSQQISSNKRTSDFSPPIEKKKKTKQRFEKTAKEMNDQRKKKTKFRDYKDIKTKSFKSDSMSISDLGPIEWFLNNSFSIWAMLIANCFKLRGLRNKNLLPAEIHDHFLQCDDSPSDTINRINSLVQMSKTVSQNEENISFTNEHIHFYSRFKNRFI